MLREGRGGFMNSAEYREMMTGVVWRGETPALSAADQVQQTKDAIGKPAPEAAMDAAKLLHQEAMDRSQGPSERDGTE